MGFKSNWSLIFERPNRRERERRGKERRRGRGREEEDEGEKFKQSQIKVWNYGVKYGATWTFNALNGSPCLYSY